MYKVYLSVFYVTVTYDIFQIVFELIDGEILNRRKYHGIEKVIYFPKHNPFEAISPDTGMKSKFEQLVYNYLKNPTNIEIEDRIRKYMDELNKLTQ